MKISLISPFPDIYSYGLRVISSVLKEAGHSTNILFLTKPFWEPYPPQVLEQVVERCKGSDLVGLSVFTNFWDNATAVTQILHDRLDIPVVWGGIHPTVRPEESLEFADYAVVGEAEETILELVENLNGSDPIRGVYARGQKVFEKRQPPKDLNHIPFPDYDLETHFILQGEVLVPMTEGLLGSATKGVYQSIPSRGCPYVCTFCVNSFLNREFPENRTVRHVDMTRLVDEIESVVKRYPVFDQVKFDDDAFFVIKMDQLENFAREYRKRIHLPLIVTGITPNTLCQDKLELLIEAGLSEVRVGVVSGEEKMRKHYKRPQTEKKVLDAANLLAQYKGRLMPNYDLIIESPWESEETLVETLRFILQFPLPYKLHLCSLTFYPGTAVYERAKREGLIKDDRKEVYRKYLHSLSPSYLNRLFIAICHHAELDVSLPRYLFILGTFPWIRSSIASKAILFLIWVRLKTVVRLRERKDRTRDSFRRLWNSFETKKWNRFLSAISSNTHK